jgi:hypothetical protein
LADSDKRGTQDNDLPYDDERLEPRNYEQVRDDIENKSSVGANSTYERVVGDGFNSDIILQHRGEPGK